MTHPEFAIDEESPRTPLLDEQEDEDLEVSKTGTRGLPLDDEITPRANQNTNVVDCNQVHIVTSHSDSPLQNLETSV